MRFWIREIAGWLLVGLGLFIFYKAYEFCRFRMLLEAWPVTVFGIFVFRGGIHLLKVAVAARICLQAQDRLYPAPAPRLRPPGGAAGRAGRARPAEGARRVSEG
jgi:hypothetical protein